MLLSDIKLQYLETFIQVVSSGSLKDAAKESGISISTVSYHLKMLESQLDVQLLNHANRPMTLTPAGRNFLPYANEALATLRHAEVNVMMTDIANIRTFRMAQTHEFDSDIAPNLAVILAGHMPKCEFSLHARPSHEILDMLVNRDIDLGISSRLGELPDGLEEIPVLNDPFVLALPMNAQDRLEDFLQGNVSLPFLRFHRDQVISTQIETHLKRLRINLPTRFEFESHQSMMAVVAAGLGWAITTPLGYMQSRRFQENVRLCKFPSNAFSRRFSIIGHSGYSSAIAQIVANTFRPLIKTHFITPMLEQQPWLKESLRLINN
jgi:DNA-binding transcriptional LysR family regulator